MTGQDIYERACAYLMEKPDEDKTFSEHVLTLINALIAEAIPYQNSRNRAAGNPEISEAAIAALDEAVKLDPALAAVALPFGLASYFLQDEVDAYQAEVYRARFDRALNDARQCAPLDVEDVYGGDA